MKLLILFALISTLAAVAYAQKPSCPELEKMGEAGIRRMFIIEEGATIPQTEAELTKRCDEGKKTVLIYVGLQVMLEAVPSTDILNCYHIDR